MHVLTKCIMEQKVMYIVLSTGYPLRWSELAHKMWFSKIHLHMSINNLFVW